jgi:hypothetical protein
MFSGVKSVIMKPFYPHDFSEWREQLTANMGQQRYSDKQKRECNWMRCDHFCLPAP